MEDSWRFPSIQDNICPTCSISHFPFCSRPLPFDRFPNDPRPPYRDPFLDHRGMPRPTMHPMRPRTGSSIDAYGISQTLDRDPFRHQMGIQRNDFYSPARYDYGGNEYMRGEFSDRTNKRMRVDDMGVGSYTHMSVSPPVGGYNSNATRTSLEDERRLNLIRNHGVTSTASPPPSNIRVDSEFRRGSCFGSLGGSQVSGYSHSSSLGDYDAWFEESRGSEWKPRPPTNHYSDPRFGSGDMAGSMLHQEPGFDTLPQVGGNKLYDEKMKPQRGEPGFGFDQQQSQSNKSGFRSDLDSLYFRNIDRSGKDSAFSNESREQPQYSHTNGFYSSLPRYGPSNVPMGAPTVNTSRHYSDSSSFVVREEDQHFMNRRETTFSASQKDDVNQQPHISRHEPSFISQDYREKYHDRDHGHNQLQVKGFDQAQDFLQSHVTEALASPGLDIAYPKNRQNIHFHGQRSDLRQPFEVKHPPLENNEASALPQNFPEAEQFGSTNINNQGTYLPMSAGNGMVSIRQVKVPDSWAYSVNPPLPPLPPSPLPMEPPGLPPYLQARSSPPKTSSSIYTVPIASSSIAPLLHPSAFEGQPFQAKNQSPDKLKIIDASCLFKPPNRAARPDHIVIILRGLPGSGKSYLAKMLRDLEVESGGKAPRIHSMDDYFMTEVEKVEESESSRSSSSVKGRKRITKKVMEYCYEPEMEEAYRSSMLKAFKKTLEEGTFTFIIVDDRNLRVADFAQFWASAKRSGYEVYLLEATYKDPVGCAARNVHGFTSDDIKRMAALWEEAPSLYLRVDIQSLFCGDDLKEHDIQEVDMDTEDVACDEGQSGSHEVNSMKSMEPSSDDCVIHGSLKDEGRWDAERDDSIGIKDLGRSKWSQDVDERDIKRSDGKGNLHALSGLIQAYGKGDKSVRWGDQAGKTGFAIGAAKSANLLSLVIGPGAGYNLRTNPLLEEESVDANNSGWELKKRYVFQEQLRAEHESFRAVFDRRRHRIGGLIVEDE